MDYSANARRCERRNRTVAAGGCSTVGSFLYSEGLADGEVRLSSRNSFGGYDVRSQGEIDMSQPRSAGDPVSFGHRPREREESNDYRSDPLLKK